MSDVRLVGTNPEDGSLVPVAVTSAGLLKTQVGRIEAIPNDLEVQGDLTVTGTINGNVGEGGSGLPEPYGPEGSVLTIKNGEPAWVVFDSPGVPAANTISLLSDPILPRTNIEPFGLWDDNEVLDESTELWDGFIKSTANWADPQPKLVGLGGKPPQSVTTIRPSFTFRLTCELGMMLDLYMSFGFDSYSNLSSDTWIEANFTSKPENFTQLTDTYKVKSESNVREMVKHTFYITRPIDDYVSFTFNISSDTKNRIAPVYGALSKWELYSPTREQRQQIFNAITAEREQAANS